MEGVTTARLDARYCEACRQYRAWVVVTRYTEAGFKTEATCQACGAVIVDDGGKR